MLEVEKELNKMKADGLRYFVNLSMWSSRQARSIWQTSGKDSYVRAPDKGNKFKWYS